MVFVARDLHSMTKKEVRSRYLSEKYYVRWKTTMQNKKAGNNAINSLKIMDSSWLRSVMFCPSSRSGRQAACTVIESLCQVCFYLVALLYPSFSEFYS